MSANPHSAPARWWLPAATLALLMLALPPVGWWPLATIALIPLLSYCARAARGAATVAGGFVGGALGVHVYLGAAVLDLQTLVASAVVLAVACAAFCALAANLLNARPVTGALLLAGLWASFEIVFELLRLPFSFGITLVAQPALLQSAALGGQGLLVFLLVATQGSVAAWATSGTWQTRATALASVALAAIVTAAGAMHRPPPAAMLKVAAVQTDIHPYIYVHGEADGHLTQLHAERRRLAGDPALVGAQLAVWPEVPFGRFELRNPQGHFWHTATGAALVAGVDFDRAGRQYNAVFGVDGDGNVVSRHVKSVLIPRLEAKYSVAAQPVPHASLPGRPGSMICFESAFTGVARTLSLLGAQLLTINTSDTYAGPSLLSSLHAAFAPLRAVENRRALVRAANAGPSSIVLPSGRTVARGDLFRAQVLTATVPLIDRPSLYTRFAGAWSATFAVLGAIAVVVGVRRVTATAAHPRGVAVMALAVLGVAVLGVAGQVGTMWQAYRAVAGDPAPVLPAFGFLTDAQAPVEYRDIAATGAARDEDAVTAAALRRFGTPITAREVAARRLELASGSIHKIGAYELAQSYGFTLAPLAAGMREVPFPCFAPLANGETVMVSRMAADAVEFFSPVEADYVTLARDHFETLIERAPMCLHGHQYAWDLR